MALGAELELEGRKLTNNSVRKTLVMKLKASNHPRSAIIDVIAHTNERLLAEYEEGVKAEQRKISSNPQLYCRPTGSEFPFSSFQFAHSAQPYSDSSQPNSSPPLSWMSGDDKLRSWIGVGVFQQSSN